MRVFSRSRSAGSEKAPRTPSKLTSLLSFTRRREKSLADDQEAPESHNTSQGELQRAPSDPSIGTIEHQQDTPPPAPASSQSEHRESLGSWSSPSKEHAANEASAAMLAVRAERGASRSPLSFARRSELVIEPHKQGEASNTALTSPASDSPLMSPATRAAARREALSKHLANSPSANSTVVSLSGVELVQPTKVKTVSDAGSDSNGSASLSTVSLPMGVEAEFFRWSHDESLVVAKVQVRQTLTDPDGKVTAFRVLCTVDGKLVGAPWVAWSAVVALVSELVESIRPPAELDAWELDSFDRERLEEKGRVMEAILAAVRR